MLKITNRWLHDPIMRSGDVMIASDMPFQDLCKWCRVWFGGPAYSSGKSGYPNGYSRLDCLSLTLGRRILDFGLKGPVVKSAVKSFRKMMDTGRYKGACLKISARKAEIVQCGDIVLNPPEFAITLDLGNFVETECRKPQYRGYAAAWDRRGRKETPREARI